MLLAEDAIELDALNYSVKKKQFQFNPIGAAYYDKSAQNFDKGAGLQFILWSHPHFSLVPGLYFYDSKPAARPFLAGQYFLRAGLLGFYLKASLQKQDDKYSDFYGVGGHFKTRMQNDIFFDVNQMRGENNFLFHIGLTL